MRSALSVIGVLAIAAVPAAADLGCVSDIRDAAPDGSFCHGHADHPQGGVQQPVITPQMHDAGTSMAGAVGDLLGGALVPALPPVKNQYGTLKGQQFNEKVDDGSDAANSADSKSVQDVLNGYNTEQSKPAFSCPDGAICLTGTTPSFAVLGENETPRHTGSASLLTADGEGPVRSHRGIGDVPDYLDRAAADAAAAPGKNWDTAQAITKYATLTANGVKAFFPDALSDDGMKPLGTAANLINGGAIAGRLLDGDVDGAKKAATWFAVGKANAWMLGEAGEPHKFVAQVITMSEKHAEETITKGVDRMGAESGLPGYYP